MRFNRLALCLMMTFAAQAFAENQTPRMPTEAEVSAAQKKLRMPTDAEISRAVAPTMPDLDALTAGVGGNIDVAGLASQMEQAGVGVNPIQSTEPQLYVFVSLSMPKESLQRILDLAERSGAVVVIRGMKDRSLKKTFAAMREVIGQRQVGVGIHPQLFQRFAVNSVPATVLAKPEALAGDCQQTRCIDPKSYAKVTGDVSIDYALEAIERQVPALRNETRYFLAKLKGH